MLGVAELEGVPRLVQALFECAITLTRHDVARNMDRLGGGAASEVYPGLGYGGYERD